jgi:hypothetical protein
MQVKGYEKAWAAFIGGGASAALTVAALWGAATLGAVEPPTSEAIAAAITGLVSATVAG